MLSNKGIDEMNVYDLGSYKEEKGVKLMMDIFAKKYLPKAIKGVEIPKSNGGKRLLGVLTVVDRWFQQALSQQLMIDNLM